MARTAYRTEVGHADYVDDLSRLRKSGFWPPKLKVRTLISKCAMGDLGHRSYGGRGHALLLPFSHDMTLDPSARGGALPRTALDASS